MLHTAKAILVTVIAAFELESRLVKDLKALGIKGYAVGKVNGHGMHARHSAGVVEDGSSLRIEMLVSPAVAETIPRYIAAHYEGQPIVAYFQDVHALPAEHFS